ncbi:MAG: hypothetical protein WA957_15545 [Alteraurantiacibacter sp.]
MMNVARILSVLVLIGLPAGVMATSPLTAPQKLTRDFNFTCRMLTEGAEPSDLSIDIRYEKLNEEESFSKDAYWWSLSGDLSRFPVNETYMNMRSVELNQPQSSLSFVAADGWRYSYQLFYGIAEDYPQRVYATDHLLVRKRLEGDVDGAWTLVAIGECASTAAKDFS